MSSSYYHTEKRTKLSSSFSNNPRQWSTGLQKNSKCKNVLVKVTGRKFCVKILYLV